MRRAYHAERSGNWEGHKEEFQNIGKISVWASARVKECHEKVEPEDISRLSIAQDILRQKVRTFRGESLRQSVEWEVSPHRTCASVSFAFRLKTASGGSPRCMATAANRRKKQLQLVVCGLSRSVRLVGSEQGPGHARQCPREAKVFRAHDASQGVCGNLINSLKRLTGRQKDGEPC